MVGGGRLAGRRLCLLREALEVQADEGVMIGNALGVGFSGGAEG